ncbi:hypothetical protein EXIGLDRAFT_664026 [Exidia glandulosa HHB12029]|uniref:Galactose oxidase n=1 Tax=Exidia glandulosa HHB12029 TaxID=1314781 RepID=A0A165R3K6_EXIGL|nr:hypothetical protein EXIGLDRAFT_664026 [Exidia glandulosa HHB12029]
MQVWKEKAYYFYGTLKIAVLDLLREQWSIVLTSLPRGIPWPYHTSSAFHGATTAILDGVLYVFGGRDGNVVLGHNIFLALDIEALRWRHISGTSDHKPQNYEPNLRAFASMWAVPETRKVYLLYGTGLRAQAYVSRLPGGSETDHTYKDFWSFHVDDNKWERERMRGNFPSPRAEFAHTWSPALGRAIVYGGYHSSLYTKDDQALEALGPGVHFRYSYFGDTLLYDPKTRLWQMVLVKGFPSYRAASSLVCDPDDGKVYLFGGYSNAEFSPSRRNIVRPYNDLWQLKIDMPGGSWDPEDLERDIQQERLGPWARCAFCASIGVGWQKCGGTCGGQSYFCSKECQKNGWKAHKEKYNCRKR